MPRVTSRVLRVVAVWVFGVALVGGVAQAAQNETFADSFSSGGYSGSTGSAAWSTPWIEQGDDGSPSGGTFQVRTHPDCSGPCLWVNGSPGLEDKSVMRTADLSGAVDATLTFSYRRVSESGDEGDGEVEVAVAASGGSWKKVLKIKLKEVDTNTRWATVSVRDWISPATSIRFKGKGEGGDVDVVIDDIVIEAAHPATTTTTIAPTTTTTTTTVAPTTTTTTTTLAPPTTTTTTTTTTVAPTTTTTTTTTAAPTTTTVPPAMENLDEVDPGPAPPGPPNPPSDSSANPRYVDKRDLVSISLPLSEASGERHVDYSLSPTTRLGAAMQSAVRTLRTNLVSSAVLGVFVAIVGIRGIEEDSDDELGGTRHRT
ncbi:hypothetical protein MNBD_ACTINO02-2334 [hydrothermal vent metagenome]|uniref:Uncharacterized protein n=1 Tax=hydrothermal vent metagenome TaxID=652676 RepID=A0A3B0TN28_9ZZZZ